MKNNAAIAGERTKNVRNTVIVTKKKWRWPKNKTIIIIIIIRH